MFEDEAVDDKDFGRRLRGLRNSQRLTQSRVNDLLKLQSGTGKGLTASYLSLLEGGSRIPSLEMFLRLCAVYQVFDDDTLFAIFEELLDWLVARTTGVAGLSQRRRHAKARVLVSEDSGRLEWAFRACITDPAFPDGNSLVDLDVPDEAKLFILGLYRRATGLNLLGEKEPRPEEPKARRVAAVDMRKPTDINDERSSAVSAEEDESQDG